MTNFLKNSMEEGMAFDQIRSNVERHENAASISRYGSLWHDLNYYKNHLEIHSASWDQVDIEKAPYAHP